MRARLRAGQSLLVATTWAKSPEALLARVASAHARLAKALGPREPATGEPPFLVEARLDLLDAPLELGHVEALAHAAPGTLLVTCRPGGPGAPRDEQDRLSLL